MRACPLCTSSDFSIYMKPTAWNNRHGIELRKCSNCRFVYSAVSTFDYSALGHDTTAVRSSKRQLLSLAREQKLPELIEEIVEKAQVKNGKALDFGCGIGLSALCLQQKGFATYGIDKSDSYLEKHKELNIISAPDFATLHAEKNSFDLIIMKDVLEHVDNPTEVLQEVLHYLKPGGYFYIRVPNVYHYNFHWSIDTQSHINHFSPKKLTTLLAKNSMKKIDFIGVYDISTSVGKLYNFIFWKTRYFLPMYHQISLLYQKS